MAPFSGFLKRLYTMSMERAYFRVLTPRQTLALGRFMELLVDRGQAESPHGVLRRGGKGVPGHENIRLAIGGDSPRSRGLTHRCLAIRAKPPYYNIRRLTKIINAPIAF